MINIQALYDLQKIDLAWDKVRRRLLQIQKSLGENDELKEKRRATATLQEELANWQAKQHDLELESQTMQTRIQDSDGLLMSGQVTNHKELESMQANLESLRRQHAHVEEQTVEAFVKTEELSKEFGSQQKALEQALGEWKAAQNELIAEGKQLKKQFLRLKQLRDDAASAIDAASINHYEQLRKRKKGVAIAPIHNDTCGACNMQAPTGIIQASQSTQTEPSYCPFCGRILFRE